MVAEQKEIVRRVETLFALADQIEALHKGEGTRRSSPNRFSPKPSAANSFLKIRTTNRLRLLERIKQQKTGNGNAPPKTGSRRRFQPAKSSR
jgi:rRNA maturation protein Nop10